jgi:hypothetical protein
MKTRSPLYLLLFSSGARPRRRSSLSASSHASGFTLRKCPAGGALTAGVAYRGCGHEPDFDGSDRPERCVRRTLVVAGGNGCSQQLSVNRATISGHRPGFKRPPSSINQLCLPVSPPSARIQHFLVVRFPSRGADPGPRGRAHAARRIHTRRFPGVPGTGRASAARPPPPRCCWCATRNPPGPNAEPSSFKQIQVPNQARLRNTSARHRPAVLPIFSRVKLAEPAGPTRTGTNRRMETERRQQSIRGGLRKRASSCRSPYRSYPAWFHSAG